MIDFLNHLPSWGEKVELDSSHTFYETYKKFVKIRVFNCEDTEYDKIVKFNTNC